MIETDTQLSGKKHFNPSTESVARKLDAVLPLTRIFPCSKKILVLARNLQGNKIYKEMARKNTQIKGNCKDFCKLYHSTFVKPIAGLSQKSIFKRTRNFIKALPLLGFVHFY